MLSYPNTIWTLVASTTRSGPSGSQEHFGKFWLTTKLPQMFFFDTSVLQSKALMVPDGSPPQHVR